MRRNGRTGWYLRVLQPGEVTIGSPIEDVQVDAEHLTVADAHRAMGDRHLSEPDLLRRLVGNPALAAEWRAPLVERLCNQG